MVDIQSACNVDDGDIVDGEELDYEGFVGLQRDSFGSSWSAFGGGSIFIEMFS